MSEATQAPPAAGTFCWNELMTGDVSGAKQFYAQLFGWKAEDRDMGPMGTYTIFMQGETIAAGCMQTPPEAGEVPPHWMGYIYVNNVDAATGKAESLGAKICVPPTDIPETGRFSMITDPTGATIGLFQKH